MGQTIDPRSFRILITGGSSGLVETIADAVSIHSIKKAEYAKRLAQGQLGHVTLLDHFISVRGSTLVRVLTDQSQVLWGPVLREIRQGPAEFRQVTRWYGSPPFPRRVADIPTIRLFLDHLPPPDQGPTQRKHLTGPRRAPGPHRLWVHVIKFSREPWVRSRSF